MWVVGVEGWAVCQHLTCMCTRMCAVTSALPCVRQAWLGGFCGSQRLCLVGGAQAGMAAARTCCNPSLCPPQL